MYWNVSDKERLLRAFELADNRNLLEKLLADLLTENERQQCETRLKAACMINDGATYKQIRSITNLSPSTIARLSKAFRGENAALPKIIKKLLSKGGVAYFE